MFWRDLSIGGDYFTSAIQKELNLSYEDAEQLKKGSNLDGISFENVIPILNSVSEDMVGEFFKKIKDYFEHIIVISHNPLIRNWSDNLIMIKKEEDPLREIGKKEKKLRQLSQEKQGKES